MDPALRQRRAESPAIPLAGAKAGGLAGAGDRLTLSLTRDRPFGDDTWTVRTVGRLGLEHTVRREGRPEKEKKADAKKR